MDWLTAIFANRTTLPAAIGLVVVLIVLITLWGVLLIRQRGGRQLASGRRPRLAIIDTTPIDNRRRLVLVRRDDVEHLVLIGGNNDLVVEEGIMPTVPAAPPGGTTGPAVPAEPRSAQIDTPSAPDKRAGSPSIDEHVARAVDAAMRHVEPFAPPPPVARPAPPFQEPLMTGQEPADTGAERPLPQPPAKPAIEADRPSPAGPADIQAAPRAPGTPAEHEPAGPWPAEQLPDSDPRGAIDAEIRRLLSQMTPRKD